ncbi:hypothetical protein, unknown function [Leishmania tarentolae]|uniref:Uncharacterized protein n=1 Tax=Leishmania tarentolae TaxID=5689 RepID=A0A640KUY1_LEITA|nr:hypothetical protein, unknown function [Leishmania tarentolae]
MHRLFIARSSDTMANTTSSSFHADCNHGVWNPAKLTCDCDAGWSTDWLNQDVLGGNYVYCNSQASTQPPSNSSAATTSFLVDKSILIMIVAIAVLLVALGGIFGICCYQKRLCRTKEEAKRMDIVAAANEKEARRREGLQLQQMHGQEEVALQEQLWAVQLEVQRQNQALLNHMMMMNALPVSSNSQNSAHQQHPQHWNEVPPRHPREVVNACEANYEGGSPLPETLNRWGSQERFVQCPSSYRRGAPLSTTDNYNNYSEVLPSYYMATTAEAPRREAHSPLYAQATIRHTPF